MKHLWSVTIGHNHLEGFAKTLIDVILFFSSAASKDLGGSRQCEGPQPTGSKDEL